MNLTWLEVVVLAGTFVALVLAIARISGVLVLW